MRVGYKWFCVLLLAAPNEFPIASSNNASTDMKTGEEYCTASIEHKDVDEVLKFTITNTTGSSLKVETSSLPWKMRSSLMLFVAEGGGMGGEPETMLPQFYPLESPGFGETRIEPGESLTGTVVLNRYFPSLKEVLKESDVVIFWSYRLKPIDSAPFKRVAGSVVIYQTQ